LGSGPGAKEYPLACSGIACDPAPAPNLGTRVRGYWYKKID
jgi:hypothetical protein